MLSPMEIETECCRLADGSLSVRVDAKEIAILPPLHTMTLYEVEQLVHKVVCTVEALTSDPEWYAEEQRSW